MESVRLKVRHFGRYRDIARLVRKYARTEPAPDDLEGGASGLVGGSPAELAADLERLGPAFIKLGQLLSTRSDLLPSAYVQELSRLQDRVAPFPFEDARRVIESELGVRLNKIFREIDPAPVAAASLAQIHRAELRDGREVAVKVQRPGIYGVVVEDMAVLGETAQFLEKRTTAGRRYELGRIQAELRKAIFSELDFAQEALHLRVLAENLAPFGRLVLPRPFEDFTTRRVLTMEFIRGRKITSVTPLRLNEVDGPALANELFRGYLKQMLVDGFFHADPHPGNILLADDGRIAILDLGLVERLGPDLQQDLLVLLLAIGDGRSEDAASAAIRIGSKREGFAEEAFRARISALVLAHRDEAIWQMSMGQIIFEIARVSGACGLSLPGALTVIGKTLMNLDQVVCALDPGFEPGEAIRAESLSLLQQRLERMFTRSRAAAGMLEVQKFAEKLPERLCRALDVLGGNELRVKVDAIDENLLIQGMQKIANRIALGVVLASLIIGAALMMQVRTTFRLFEYPGLAIILFLGAAAASVILILDILYYDDKRRSRARGSVEPRRP